MSSVTHTSGNYIVDRRLSYAQAAFDAEDWQTAIDVLEQTLEEEPHFVPVLILLARALIASEKPLSEIKHQTVVNYMNTALEIDPQDPLGARLILTQLGETQGDQALSNAFIAGLFDQYASRFDHHLVHDLHYRAPQVLLEALQKAFLKDQKPFTFSHVLDVGCGTGLMGEVLRPCARHMIGCDLSEKMIAQARTKQCYNDLHVDDIHTFLSNMPEESADLIVAADVLVYVGALTHFSALSFNVLSKGGYLAFTLQSYPDHFAAPYHLGEDQRYSHQRDYSVLELMKSGFQIVSCEETSTRHDRGQAVAGLVIIAQK
jgi:predicted TPR repeat methyltransferase